MNVNDTLILPTALVRLRKALELRADSMRLHTFDTSAADQCCDEHARTLVLDTLTPVGVADAGSVASAAWALSLAGGYRRADLLALLVTGADYATHGVDTLISEVADTWAWLSRAGSPDPTALRAHLVAAIKGARWATECAPQAPGHCGLGPPGETVDPDCVELLVADGPGTRLTCVRELPDSVVQALAKSLTT